MGSMTNDDLILLGVGALAAYELSDSLKSAFKPLTDMLNVPSAAWNTVSAGVNNPGGVLGKNSLTDPAYQAQQVAAGLAAPGGLVGKNSTTDFFTPIQNGINTPGGWLGQGSITDFGFQLNNFASGLGIW